jgi:SAM-dependent methyltransferase
MGPRVIDNRVNGFGYSTEEHLATRVRFHFLFPSTGPNVHEWLEEILGPLFSQARAVLDVGAGIGVFWQNFLPRWKRGGTTIILSDLSPAMIRALRNNISDADVSIVPSDVDRLPFQKSSFDLVLCHSVLHYSQRPLDAVKNLRELLTNAGTLSILVPGILNMREMHDIFMKGGYGIDLLSRPLMSFTEVQADQLKVYPFAAAKIDYRTVMLVNDGEAVANYFLSHPEVSSSANVDRIRSDLVRRATEVISLRGCLEVTRQYCLYLIRAGS